MLKAKHFSLYEYLPRSIYEDKGEWGWCLIDDRLIRMNDLLRETVKPLVLLILTTGSGEGTTSGEVFVQLIAAITAPLLSIHAGGLLITPLRTIQQKR